MSGYHESLARNYDARMGDEGDLHHRLLLDPPLLALLPTNDNAVVLDAGCGNGYLTRKLARRYSRVTGIDNSQELLAIAQEKRSADNIDYVFGDLEQSLPFPNASFDLVVSHMTLHHVERLDTVASEFARIIRIGGCAIISLTHPDYEMNKDASLGNSTTRMRYTRPAFDQTDEVVLYYEPLETFYRHFNPHFDITQMQDITITPEYADRDPKYQERVGQKRAHLVMVTKM